MTARGSQALGRAGDSRAGRLAGAASEERVRILLSGGSGFVGGGVLQGLLRAQHEVLLAVRRPLAVHAALQQHVFAGFEAATDWQPVLRGVDALIHAAARVHVRRERAGDPWHAYRRINVEGTLQLARQAALAGVRRFVFLSSVKVHGEASVPGRPFQADGPVQPLGAYALSKLEAEQGLFALAAETGMQVVIIRPPLVYGPGVKANFRSLMDCLARGIPLPLGAVDNRRSLVALDNLVDLVVTCLAHPAAANQVFLVSDGQDLSTGELLRRLGRALDRPARLLPVPVCLLRAGAALLGRKALAERLCGSLQVDIGKTRELLGWTPPVRLDEALGKTAAAFLAGRPA